MIGRDGIGCEPASATTVAGIRKLTAASKIQAGESVVAVLTGHVLKDPDYVSNYHRGTLSFESATAEGTAKDRANFRRISQRAGKSCRQQGSNSQKPGEPPLRQGSRVIKKCSSFKFPGSQPKHP